MPKTDKTAHKKNQKFLKKRILYFTLGITLGLLILSFSAVYLFEQTHENRTYPGISIANINFGGQTVAQVSNYWLKRNLPFEDLTLTFQFEDKIATLSGKTLEIGFDATLSATQAYSVGRSGNILADINQKYTAWKDGVELEALFRFREDLLDETLTQLSQTINIEPENALFEFQNNRVIAFKPSQVGRSVDTETVKTNLKDQLQIVATRASPDTDLVFVLPVLPKEPLIKTEQANDLGIEELIGSGESFFRGSIPGRVHNIALAASRINGVLIPPGETFSFNDAVGDISAATGYKQAYVIKQGRTVLDDGGGVCQVSTTLFRAALNTGLPIAERHAHSYRVAYYEQGGWKPGFDATVYAPSYDLKITNDTPAYILIQSTTDTKNTKLTYELYGKKDERIVALSPVRLWDSKPPPPDLNQDDPTLPAGTVKQVDWAASGIKAAFDYSVRRDGEELYKNNFFSNFIPWQAVYLHGTGPAQ